MKAANVILLFLLSTNLLLGQYDENQGKIFTSLEVAMKTPSRIYFLDLSQQSLTEVPKEIMSFENLIFLNLAHNDLSTLDGLDFSLLKDLEEIILYDNKFRFFPYDAFDTAPNLRIIDLGENDLKSINNELNNLRFLERITLCGNRIAQTAKDIKLPHLKQLNLERNALTQFPEFTSQSPKLEMLNIYGNNIKNIPAILNECSKLKSLNIGDNPINYIHEAISLRKLKTLILDWVDLSKQNLSIYFVKKSNLLETLSMEHCQLTEIPDEVFSLRRLKELSVLNNDLKKVDKNIFNVKKLAKFWISGNQISTSEIVVLKEKMKNTEVILE